MRTYRHFSPAVARGFTLVEMVVVLAILGVLLSVGIGAMTAQVASSAYSSSKEKQQAIKSALTAYLASHKRLPCPDTDSKPDGIENPVGGPCTSYFGTVPYITLGISRDMALDAWKAHFGYAVSEDWANDTTLTTDDRGTLMIATRDDSSAALSANTEAAVIVISYGANGLGGRTIAGTSNLLPSGADELQNAQPDFTKPFISREYTDDVGAHGAFDDLVLAITANEFIAPLRKDGSLRSSRALAQEALNLIDNDVMGRTLSNREEDDGDYEYELPSPALVLEVYDPWDEKLIYEKVFSNKIRSDTNDSAIAYCLKSKGSDKSLSGSVCSSSGDDIVQVVKVGALKGLLARTGF